MGCGVLTKRTLHDLPCKARFSDSYLEDFQLDGALPSSK